MTICWTSGGGYVEVPGTAVVDTWILFFKTAGVLRSQVEGPSGIPGHCNTRLTAEFLRDAVGNGRYASVNNSLQAGPNLLLLVYLVAG